jgi:hypothetical protein
MHIESGQPSGRIRFRYDSELFTRWDDIPFQKIRQIAAGLAETAGKDATRMKFKDIDSTIKVRVLRDGVPVDIELRFASQPTLYSPSIVLRSQLNPIRDLAGVGFLKDQIRERRTRSRRSSQNSRNPTHSRSSRSASPSRYGRARELR